MDRFQPKGAAFSKNPRLLQSTFSPEIYRQLRVMRAQEAREKQMSGAQTRVMNFDNFFTKTQNSDLNTNRSSFVSTNTRKYSRIPSRVSSNKLHKYSDVRKSERGSVMSPQPKPSNQFLQVPTHPYAGSSLATRMDFILRKRTRLLERQKTKENQLNLTFKYNDDNEPLP
jgi:hypothetical protein